MTEEQKFIFDLKGYLSIPQTVCISRSHRSSPTGEEGFLQRHLGMESERSE